MNGHPLLDSLHRDVEELGPTMKAFAQRVVEEGISQFPIFVASGQPVNLGKPFADKEDLGLNFYFHASILEEFVQRNLIQEEKVQPFQDSYGNVAKRACIFLVLPEEASFVFVPY